MLFFAITNAEAFIATLLFVPSMPVKEKLSYGSQLSVLKNSITWLSIAAVIFMNSAIFGVYSYLAEYLENFWDDNKFNVRGIRRSKCYWKHCGREV